MEKIEQEALYSVIRGFVGEWWNGSRLYPDPCGWTPIQGVSCDLFDELWYITVLSIGPVHDNSLECAEDAKFSQSLFSFKHLKSLSFNCFSSNYPTTIPAEDWEMLEASLETLEFRSNRGLIGEIPAGLGRLTNLESLVLAENVLTDCQLNTYLNDLSLQSALTGESLPVHILSPHTICHKRHSFACFLSSLLANEE